MKTAGDDGDIIEGEFVEAPGRRLRRLLPWLLAGLLAAFIGGLFAAPTVERSLQSLGLVAAEEAPPPSADPRAGESFEALRSRIATLETALYRLNEDVVAAAGERAELARKADAPTGSGSDDAGLAPALDALGDRVAALESLTAALPATVAPAEIERLVEALATAAAERERMAARLDALNRRLTGLETRGRGEGSGAPAIAVHLIALAARLDRGAPFADRLALLESEVLALPPALRAGLAESLTRLGAVADSGVASRADLAARFDGLAFDLVRARPAPADEGFWDALVRRMSPVLVVRRTGEPAGEDAAAIVARAEAALGRDDLAGAVGELAALDPAIRTTAADWLADARRRLDAEAALATLVARLASPGQAAGGP